MIWRSNYLWRILFIFLCLGAISGIVFYWLQTAQAETISTSVTIMVCGNMIIEGSETCDDGNTVSGDGCSSICRTETAAPSGEGEGPRTIPSSPEQIIYTTRVILEGMAYPNTSINILKDGQYLTVVTADSQANFRVEIKDLTPGNYTFGLWAEDKNGSRSSTFTITFYVAPAVTTTVSGILLPPTISLSKPVLLKGETLKIFGQSTPESRIEIFVYQDTPLKEVFSTLAVTDYAGNWYYLFDTAELKEGVYKIKAKATTKEGFLSIFSYALPLEIQLVKPPVPPIPPEPPVPPTPPISGVSPSADLNKDNRVNFIDFSILLYFWGRASEYADLNQDGIVNLIDFSIMMYYWTG